MRPKSKIFSNKSFFKVKTPVVSPQFTSGKNVLVVFIKSQSSVFGSISIGFGPPKELENVSIWVGDTENSYSISSRTGQIWNHKNIIDKSTTRGFSTNDVIFLEVDCDKSTFKVFLNSSTSLIYDGKFKIEKEKDEKNVPLVFALTIHRSQEVGYYYFNRTENTKLYREKLKERKTKVKFLSQNLWNAHLGGKGDKPERRFVSFAKICADYDILILQECFILKSPVGVFGMKEVDAMLQELSNYGFYYFTDLWNTINEVYVGQNSGCVIVSKMPIIDSDYFAFKTKGSFTKKGMVYGIVEINKKKVCIVDVHLDSTSDKKIRSSQVLQIVSTLEKVEKDEVILSGDFNTCPQPIFDDGTEFREMLGSMKDYKKVDILNEKNEHVPTFFKVGSRRERCTLDHVFFSDGIFGKVCDAKVIGNKLKFGEKGKPLQISDHKGISFAVDFEKQHLFVMNQKIIKEKKDLEQKGHEKIVKRMRAKMIISRLFGWGEDDFKYNVLSDEEKKKILSIRSSKNPQLLKHKMEFLKKFGISSEELQEIEEEENRKNKKTPSKIPEGKHRKFTSPILRDHKFHTRNFVKENILKCSTPKKKKFGENKRQKELVDLEVQCGDKIFMFKVSPEHKRKFREKMENQGLSQFDDKVEEKKVDSDPVEEEEETVEEMEEIEDVPEQEQEEEVKLSPMLQRKKSILDKVAKIRMQKEEEERRRKMEKEKHLTHDVIQFDDENLDELEEIDDLDEM